MGTRDEVLDWAARGPTSGEVALVPPPSTSQPRCSPAVGQRRSEDSDCMTESSFAQQQSRTDPFADGAAPLSFMRAVYDQVDWSATPLGQRDAWPALLRLL